ncbi:MAG: LysR family transcriptional regulator [Armatimonadetes bacterium]|nr:LysR family transcriptional regulator [Armatimonadota bacterium]
MADERLRTFVTVARCGSLSAAARELFISQPAVTQQVHKLEAEYRCQLFLRHERGVKLTPAGEVLREHALRVVELEEQAGEALAALQQSLRGTLRLGATFTLGEYLLPPILARFKAAHPDVELLLEIENAAKVVEHVAGGAYGCGVIEGPHHNPFVRSEKLADDELVVICGPSHPFAGRAELGVDDLRTATWVLREPGSGTRTVFEDGLAAAGIDPESLSVLMRVGSTQAVKGVVREGLALTAVSPWTVREELESGALVRLAVPALELHRAFQFIFARGARLPLVTRRFVKYCREQVAEKLAQV